MIQIIIVVDGFIGRGINGISEIKIKSDSYSDIITNALANKVAHVQITGEIIAPDNYFLKQELAGKHNFIIPTDKIQFVIND